MNKISESESTAKREVFLKELHALKAKFLKESEKMTSLESLAGMTVDREPGLWECTYAELEDEIWQRFSDLEVKTEDMLKQGISVPRKPWSWFVNLYEKSVKFFLGPYRKHIVLMRNLIDKQMLFNKELISVHLATILSLLKLKDRLTVLEIQSRKLIEEQEDLSDEFDYLEKSRKDG